MTYIQIFSQLGDCGKLLWPLSILIVEKRSCLDGLASREFHGDPVSSVSPPLQCCLVPQLRQGALAQVESLFQILFSVFIVDGKFFVHVFEKGF
jgi:hypothetical protein